MPFGRQARRAIFHGTRKGTLLEKRTAGRHYLNSASGCAVEFGSTPT